MFVSFAPCTAGSVFGVIFKDIYVTGRQLLLSCCIFYLLFTLLSLLCVDGNKKNE